LGIVDTTLGILIGSAISIGFIHTLIGIDHSLPFVVLGRAQGWRLRKVLGLTFLCGLGHVLSSVILGGIGIGLGIAASRLEWVEGARGSLASWTLIAFGLVYAGWSIARHRRRQRHVHEHSDGTVHTHEHVGLPHNHTTVNPAVVTGWSLFVIFVLGPCEPLIPLLIVPALSLGVWPTVLIASAFGVTTIATMMALVAVGHYGLQLAPMRRLEAHVHTLAGLAIAASGFAIKLFGI
jgi:sulfite exporter TauE/SafE